MNIFMTSPDPSACAVVMDDRRLIKMVLETAQLLSSAYRLQGLGDNWAYKVTHQNHPCAVWCRDSKANLLWLCAHGIELANEYAYRYGKRHKSLDVILQARTSADLLSYPETGYRFDCSGQAVGNVFDNYRACMLAKWDDDGLLARWTKRERPTF